MEGLQVVHGLTTIIKMNKKATTKEHEETNFGGERKPKTYSARRSTEIIDLTLDLTLARKNKTYSARHSTEMIPVFNAEIEPDHIEQEELKLVQERYTHNGRYKRPVNRDGKEMIPISEAPEPIYLGL